MDRNSKVIQYLNTLVIIIVATLLLVGCPDKKATQSFIEKNYEFADLIRGGLLYDKWWKVNGGTEPMTDFNPIWSSQSTNARMGADTWRCKECHGWDYIGLDGRYSSGSHFTGFEGVWDTRNDHMEDVFDAIEGMGSNHDWSVVLSVDDIADLTKFIQEGLIDMNLYINGDGNAMGSSANGKTLYNSNCSSCHGLDGETIDFKSSEGTQGIGWLTNDNPQESLHKIRFGHPGSSMPSMVEQGLSASEQSDILAYGQSLPGAYNTAISDIVQGGLLYDKWWKVNGGAEPMTNFEPIWSSQSTNARMGADTWRCKECHGWDYIGLDGRYSSGSHFTGFEGVLHLQGGGASDIFNAIKDEGGNHDLSSVLSDSDIGALAKFILEGLTDMGMFINGSGTATGNIVNGETLYNANCSSCHGVDGNTLDFKGDDGIQGVGWLANDNPQETLHKIRWGHPGSTMTSAVIDGGLTDQETGDILAYGQSLE